MERSDRLRWAVVHGNLPIIKRLLRRFPDMLENPDPENGWTSLHYAGKYGHYLVCVDLVQRGHDRVEISLDHHRNTPLHLAAAENHEQTVHYLAQHMSRCLDWKNMEDETALMVAARRGNDPCINLLLDFGADIDLADRKGNRPIHIAAAYGHLKTLRTLIERNADTQCQNNEGLRPVQYCSTYQVQDYLQSLIHEKSESKKKQQAFYKPGANGSSTNLLSGIAQFSPSRKTFVPPESVANGTAGHTQKVSPLLLPPINRSAHSGVAGSDAHTGSATSSPSSAVSSPISPALASPATLEFPSLTSNPFSNSSSQPPSLTSTLPLSLKKRSPSRFSASSSPATPANGSPHRASGSGKGRNNSNASHEKGLVSSPTPSGSTSNMNENLAPPQLPLFIPPRRASLSTGGSMASLAESPPVSMHGQLSSDTSSGASTPPNALNTPYSASASNLASFVPLAAASSAGPSNSFDNSLKAQQATGGPSATASLAPSLPMPNFGHAFRGPSSISVVSGTSESSGNPSMTSLDSTVTQSNANASVSRSSAPTTPIFSSAGLSDIAGDSPNRTSPYSTIPRSRVLDIAVSSTTRNNPRPEYQFI